MPADKNHRIPACRFHKPTGQAYVRLNGRMIYLGKYGQPESRQEYDRLIAEWKAAGRQVPPQRRGARRAADGLTIGEMVNTFRVYVEKYYRHPDGSPTKEVECFRYAMKPLCQAYSGTMTADFGPLALKAVREQMIALGWSRSYVNSQIGRVRQAFKWATENQLVPASVYHGLQAVSGLKYGRSDGLARCPWRANPVPDACGVWWSDAKRDRDGMRTQAALVEDRCDRPHSPDRPVMRHKAHSESANEGYGGTHGGTIRPMPSSRQIFVSQAGRGLRDGWDDRDDTGGTTCIPRHNLPFGTSALLGRHGLTLGHTGDHGREDLASLSAVLGRG